MTRSVRQITFTKRDVVLGLLQLVVVRPVRDVEAAALGRVQATCWHETYDHLISRAALESVSARRMAELWKQRMNQGWYLEQYRYQ